MANTFIQIQLFFELVIHAKYLGRIFLVKVLRRDSSRIVLYLVTYNLEKTSVISRNSLNIRDWFLMYLGKEDHQNVVYNMALITLMLLL